MLITVPEIGIAFDSCYAIWAVCLKTTSRSLFYGRRCERFNFSFSSRSNGVSVDCSVSRCARSVTSLSHMRCTVTRHHYVIVALSIIGKLVLPLLYSVGRKKPPQFISDTISDNRAILRKIVMPDLRGF